MKPLPILVLLLSLLSPILLQGQTTLFPGDLTIVNINSDGAKNFDLLLLSDISAGTVFKLTDDAWMDDNQSFRGSEGILTYTASSDMTAGTVISCPGKDGGNGFVESGNFNPAGSGDNLIVYQGDESDPFFIFAIGWARGSTVWEYSEISASYRSDVPMGLSFDDGTVVRLGTSDNYRLLSGARDPGSRGDLLQRFADASNFDSSNADGYTAVESAISVLENSSSSTGSGEWNSLTWSNGLPDNFVDVSVSGSVWIESDISVHSLRIEAGAVLEIHPGGSLTVSSQIINNNGSDALVIKADAAGSGALYHACDAVNGTVEVYLSADQWHFVSSPVSGAGSVDQVFGSAGSHLYGVYTYDEVSGSWTSQSTEAIEAMTGYNIYYQNNPKTLEFTGIVNSFRYRSSIYVSRGAGEGWNLIGNPFPCPISWGQAIDGDACGWQGSSSGLEHKTIYITTGGSQGTTSWDTYNGSAGIGVPNNQVKNIAPGQAFWIKAKDGPDEIDYTSLEIGHYAKTKEESRFKSGNRESGIGNRGGGAKVTPSVTPFVTPFVTPNVTPNVTPDLWTSDHGLRTSDPSLWTSDPSLWTSDQQPWTNDHGPSPLPLFRIQLSNASNESNISDQTVISFHPKAEQGYDKLDSKKYSYGTGNSPQIVTMEGGIPLAINSLPRDSGTLGRGDVGTEGKGTNDQRPWTFDPGPLSPDIGPRTTDFGFWTPDPGPWTLDLGFFSPSSSNYNISLLNKGSNIDFFSIILKDHVLGIECDLSAQPAYEFHAEGGLFEERFTIRFKIKNNRAEDELIEGMGRTLDLRQNGKVLDVQVLGRWSLVHGQSPIQIDNGFDAYYFIVDGVGQIINRGVHKGYTAQIPLNITSGIYTFIIVEGGEKKYSRFFWNNY